MSSSNNQNQIFLSSELKKRKLGGRDFYTVEALRGALNRGRWGFISDQDRKVLADQGEKTDIIKYGKLQNKTIEFERKLADDYFTAEIPHQFVAFDWVYHSNLIGPFGLPENDLFRNLMSPIEDMMLHCYIPAKIFVLGLPSLHLSRYASVSSRQHVLAHQIVRYIVQRIYNNYSAAGDKFSPHVFIDNTHFLRQDQEMLQSEYESPVNPRKPQEKPLWDLHFGLLASWMLQLKSRNNFIIMFKPENPIRQMLEAFLGDDPATLPEAIICAPGEVDNEIPQAHQGVQKYYSGDRNSDLVRDWLGNLYNRVEFTTSNITEGGEQVFGNTCLHIRSDLWPTTATPNLRPSPGYDPKGTGCSKSSGAEVVTFPGKDGGEESAVENPHPHVQKPNSPDQFPD